jgi:protein-tyrosine phosphatase
MRDWFQVGERLYGGCYPVSLPPGVDFVIDLTEEGELLPYAHDGIEHQRMAIRDLSTPTREEMRRILDTIDEAFANGRTVFVHCRGGVGRTGTVIGCHLRRHGRSIEDTFAWLEGRPETEEQRELIRGWRRGE